MQTDALDEAERKRLQRNARRVKRRAEMTDEQRQEINRKQREYRARKKRNQAILPTLSKHQVQWQVCKDKVDCRPVTQFI